MSCLQAKAREPTPEPKAQEPEVPAHYGIWRYGQNSTVISDEQGVRQGYRGLGDIFNTGQCVWNESSYRFECYWDPKQDTFTLKQYNRGGGFKSQIIFTRAKKETIVNH